MQLRERLRYVSGSQVAAPPRQEKPLPPGVISGENEYGRIYFRDEFFPLDHLHGRIRLDGAFAVDDVLLGRLGAGLTHEHVAEAAYLDIETTGLSGGTGTFAFLVGVGTFDNMAFRVRQYFLTDPGEEPAMLAALAETLARCRSLVTFNGRSFDVPQLTTRYAMVRQAAPFDLPHIDLLHPARRLYARMLTSCRLAEVEKHLLGLRRYGDVSGAVIPALYFSYIRRRNLRGLPPLFEHNSLDVLSLVAFLAHLMTDAGEHVESDAAHHFALGKWDETASRPAEAIEQYRRVLAIDTRTEVGGEAAVRLGRLLRRRDGWRVSLDHWLQEADGTSSAIRRVRAHLELAKLYEHRAGDVCTALHHAELARDLISSASLHGFFSLTGPSLEQRILRLHGKVTKRRHLSAAASQVEA
ncbi:MAG: ribonuclease H-like domain-containing protein [Dehalococcoidia bacterium]